MQLQVQDKWKGLIIKVNKNCIFIKFENIWKTVCKDFN